MDAPDPRILAAIPHRPPFLLVDGIVEEGPRRIVAHRTFPASEPFYAGHYPGQPITPGVLVCEALFQAGAVLAAHALTPEQALGVPVLSRIREARFRRAVYPGERIELDVELVELALPALDFVGIARVGGKVCVKIGFACMLARAETLRPERP